MRSTRASIVLYCILIATFSRLDSTSASGSLALNGYTLEWQASTSTQQAVDFKFTCPAIFSNNFWAALALSYDQTMVSISVF
jgi:hypothetical protein